MSAPHSPGGVSRARLSISAATAPLPLNSAATPRHFAACGVRFLHECAVVFYVSAGIRILHYAGKGVGREFRFAVLARAYPDALRDGAGGDNGKCLREYAFVHKHHVGSRLLHIARAQGVHHRHGFGGGGCLVQQGAVGKGHAGEVAYGGLEVQQGFQASLRHFGLVGCIGGVPDGVLEHVALDYGRRHGVVPPHADVSGVEFVFGCQRRDVLSELVFGHGFGQCQRFFETDIRGDGFINQLVQAAHSDFAEHLLFVLFADADVAVSQ